MRDHYIGHFIKFMRYWNKKGCGLPDDVIAKLPGSAVVTEDLSNRGRKDKKVVRYKSIEDSLGGDIESKRYAPTWRRMAMCILKNDHLCKGLSFGQTQNQVEKQKQLLDKYKNL
jgi:predicted phosphoadenosine phosphosulfate sulfurtransferase